MKVSQAAAAWTKQNGFAAANGTLSAVTARNYARDLADFQVLLAERAGDPELTALDVDVLDDVLHAYSQLPDARYTRSPDAAPAGRSAATLRRFYYTLSAFYTFCADRGWVAANPMRGTFMHRGKSKAPLENPKRKSIGTTGTGKLLSGPLTARDEFILRVFTSVGVRVGELCAADRGDLEYDARSGTWWLTLLHTKNRRPRRVPLSDLTVSFYLTYRDQEMVPAQARPNRPDTLTDSERALLRTSRGRRMTPRDMQNLLQRTGRRVSVDVTPHGLRHTAATVLLESGKDVHQVRQLLGHSTIAVTSLYLDADDLDVADAVNNSPVERLGRNGR